MVIRRHFFNAFSLAFFWDGLRSAVEPFGGDPAPAGVGPWTLADAPMAEMATTATIAPRSVPGLIDTDVYLVTFTCMVIWKWSEQMKL